MNAKLLAAAALSASLTLAATAATAGASFRNVDALIAGADGGGQIIVALDIACRGGGNFVIQTNRRSDITYKGCAFRDGNRVVVRWNDGDVYSYSAGIFDRRTAWMDL